MSLAVSSKISDLGVSKTLGWGLSFFKECCFRLRVRVRVRVRLGLFRVRVRVSMNSNPNPKTDSLKKRRPRPRPQPRPRVLPTPIESKEQNFFRLTIFTLNFGPFYAHRLTPFRPSYNRDRLLNRLLCLPNAKEVYKVWSSGNREKWKGRDNKPHTTKVTFGAFLRVF